MLQGFSASGSSEQNGVGALGGSLGELVESDDFSSGLDDSFSGSVRDLQAADAQLGHGQESLVVENVAHDHQGSLKFLLGVGHFDKSGQRDWVFGGSALVESLQYHLVEVRVGSSGQELVKLLSTPNKNARTGKIRFYFDQKTSVRVQGSRSSS